MSGSNRFYVVCRHVNFEHATPIVYFMPGDYHPNCDGYIVCARRDKEDWHFTHDNWRSILSDYCTQWLQGPTWVKNFKDEKQ
jgi:hypothetical protein